MNEAFQALQEIVLSTALDSEASYKAFCNQYDDEYKKFMSAKLDRMLKTRKLTNMDIVQMLDGTISESLLSYSRNPAKQNPFRISVTNITRICYQALGISLHEFLTDEKPTIVLPLSLGAVVDRLDAEKRSNTKAQIKLAADLRNEAIRYSVWDPEVQMSLAQKRIEEVCGDRMASFSKLTERENGKIAGTVLAYLSSAQKRLPLLKTVIYIAIRSNIPIDYFAAQNYAPFADLAYYDPVKPKKEPMPLTNITALYVVNALLSLPSEEREKEIAKLLVI